ncbi:hypothetical protein NEILACOT_03543 [Neisseria lactamica ATCC 23970]|uniref:Uncharacterized protein n=2 Tax=Neisseria lactamica TaxID=486 RepID=D0W7P3_NEILA|nr:hypothetical protein [Neisseria lactamica]EEZ76428.1 hypothetical protein NEILACOT_03543 [Neisseria lactamica ATCC 23970]KFJ35715.1 hypothetical protein DR91_313 [Neisseria lactamica ATCC 23970]SUA17254.1 Uncharacterised protein [Neisseria lactamica]VTQ48202.1 Uncharacterised protein [Neisseria lactamica]
MKIKECLPEIIKLLSSINNKLDRPEGRAGMPSENGAHAEQAERQLHTAQARHAEHAAELERALKEEKQRAEQLERQLHAAQAQHAEHTARLERALQEAQERARAGGGKAAEEAKKQMLDKIEEQIRFQMALEHDAALEQGLLGKYADIEKLPKLVRTVAIVSQWKQVERVWDDLKKRCDAQRRAATESELAILKGCIDIHNLSYTEGYNLASLKNIAAGTAFNMKEHTRATPTGDTVAEQWLPALVNAGGIVSRQALVATK